MVIKAKRSLLPRSRRKLLLVAVLLIALILAGLELTNTTHLLHKRKAVSGTIPATHSSAPKKASSQAKSTASTTPSTETNTSQKSDTATSGYNGPLVTPYGTFVSNHSPSLSGANGVPSQEQSTCITTPGAKCYITFTKDGVAKTLASQTADSKGTVYWDWDVNKAGFTEGSWVITATATSNGQSKNASDSLQLKVNP